MRECTNQLIEFNTIERRMIVSKTNGLSVGARKNHCATVFKNSMLVYGGQTENGVFVSDMIVLQFDNMEWMKV